MLYPPAYIVVMLISHNKDVLYPAGTDKRGPRAPFCRSLFIFSLMNGLYRTNFDASSTIAAFFRGDIELIIALGNSILWTFGLTGATSDALVVNYMCHFSTILSGLKKVYIFFLLLTTLIFSIFARHAENIPLAFPGLLLHKRRMDELAEKRVRTVGP